MRFMQTLLPSNMQFCRDCLVELRGIETIPYTINMRYRLERVINHGVRA